jgi:hypothetical protein
MSPNDIRTAKLFGLSILVFILFPILLLSSNSLAQEKSKSSIKKLLLEEIKKHPNSRVEDIYKFIHQASFGSEHAVKDKQAVRKWMENEIANLDSSNHDELMDHLSQDGKLVRINLRPFLKKGYDPNLLLNAFIRTANNYKGSVENFKSYWKAAKELAKTKKFTFTAEEMSSFFEEQSKKGFPAVHHSTEYEAEYKPAYRVIDLQYFPSLNR